MTETKVTKLMSAEEVMALFEKNHARRRFSISDVKEYAYGLLKPEKAFALSKLLPKDILQEVLLGKRGSMFADRIIDYHQELSKLGPLKEAAATKRAEQVFLSVHLAGILALVGGRHGNG